MKILILGGTGYLGRKTTTRLLAGGCDIVCIYRDASRIGESIPKTGQLRYVHIDKLKEFLIQEQGHIDWFVNMACKYIRPGIKDEEVWEANLHVPLKCFLLCMNYEIKEYLTIDTGLPEDFNIYSKSKKIFSEIGRHYAANLSGIRFFNIELENFYGRDEPKGRFLPDVIEKLECNEDVRLTEGIQHRDFIYVDDVVNNLYRLMTNPPYIGYHDIPLGSGQAPAVRDVIEYLSSQIGSKSNLLFGAVPMRKNEPDTLADEEKMKDAGIVIEYAWKDGMRKLTEGKAGGRE